MTARVRVRISSEVRIWMRYDENKDEGGGEDNDEGRG